MTRVRDLLHDAPPFAGLDLSDVAPDLSGWGSTHPVFEALISRLRPARIIEVGTWKGGSAIHMAQLMKAHGIAGEVVCVDTWLGAPIAWTSEPDLKGHLRLRGGYPHLFETFARNVVDAGLEDTITPLPASSLGGAQILSWQGVMAPLIYVDADHDYLPCKLDLEAYFALLEPGGVLVGDDFGCFPGVTRAVTEFAEAHDLYAVKLREKIVLSRTEIARTYDLVSDGHYDRRPASAPQPA